MTDRRAIWTTDAPSTVFHADNLAVLPQLPDGAFTVVYLDPPFNTGRAQTRVSTTSVRVAEPGAGIVSGFKVNTPVENVAAPTKMVQEKVSGIKQTVLWFEALMDAKSTALAQSNVSLLTTGQMSAETYMSQLQASIDANK